MGPQSSQPFQAPPQMQPPQTPAMQPGTPGQFIVGTKPKKPVGLIVTVILLVLLSIGAFSFAAWAVSERNLYKNDADQLSAKAVSEATTALSAKKDQEFAEKEKSPFKEYKGPAEYGGLAITYPKTWSAYVVEDAGKSSPVDGYFHPNFVPGVQSKTAFALRLEVAQRAYADQVKRYEALAKGGKVKISPYTLPKVAGATGIRVDGEFETKLNGSMVILPLRDKTIEIATLSPDFKTDFDNIILANMTFTP